MTLDVLVGLILALGPNGADAGAAPPDAGSRPEVPAPAPGQPQEVAPPLEVFDSPGIDSEVAPAAPSGAERSGLQSEAIDVHHRVHLTLLVWPDTPALETPALLGEMEYRLRATGPLGRWLRFVAEPIVRAVHGKRHLGLHGTLRGARLRFDEGELIGIRERQLLDFKELLIATRTALELSVGWQIISWGRSDAFRPLDIFQRVDLTDRLRDETLGVPSVTASWQHGWFGLDAVWVPVAALSRVPYSPANVWAVRPPDAIPYRVSREGEPATDLKTGEVGIRLSANTPHLDAALIGARSRDRTPSFLDLSVETDLSGAPTAVLSPMFEPYYLLGGNLAVPVGPLLARLDAAYVWYRAPAKELLRNGVRGVVGLEVRRGLFSGRGSLFGSLQYLVDTTTPGTAVLVDNRLASPFRIFRHATTASLIFDWGETLELSAKAFLDTKTRATVARGEVRYELREGLAAWLGGDLVASRADSWLETVDDADRILIGLDVATR